MKEAKLIISRPFIPTSESDILDCFYYFVDLEYFDEVSVIEVCRAYAIIYVEQTVYSYMKKIKNNILSPIIVIDDIVKESKKTLEEVRVALLVSSDTHVHFMKQLADKFKNHIYIIPSLNCKNEGAAEALQNMSEEYIEIDYKAKECAELLEFNPACIFCGADWTSEYLAVSKIIQNKNIRMIAMQEGPEDWHFRIARKNIFKVLNHYRNAKIIFTQGAKTLSYIRPKYFVVTGNPKISGLDFKSDPVNPRVLINCNFTYLETKPAYESERTRWMKSVLGVCKKIGIDYVISIHPRDNSEWIGEPCIHSSAFILKEELLKCSLVISRFSTVHYEALACGRESIYYNIHMEPMSTLQDEMDSQIPCVYEETELENILKKHMNEYPRKLDIQKISYFLNRHVAKMDGHVIDRITNGISGIGGNNVHFTEKLVQKIGKQIADLKHDTEWFCYPNNNVMVVLGNEKNIQYNKGLLYAEYLADKGKHVLLIVPSYSDKLNQYLKYQYHQNIEIIPTRNYLIDLNGINVSEIFITCDLFEEKKIVENVKNSNGVEGAELSIIQ